MKYIIVLVSTIYVSAAFAGDWIAVDGGVVEIRLNQVKIEDELWQYLDKRTEYKFGRRDTYTYQYQVISSTEMKIGASCHVQNKIGLDKSFIFTLDGGPCYFRIIQDLRTGGFSRLEVNGEA